MVDQRRVDEVAIGGKVLSAVDNDRGSVGGCTVDVALDLVAMFGGDQRTHLVIGFVARGRP